MSKLERGWEKQCVYRNMSICERVRERETLKSHQDRNNQNWRSKQEETRKIRSRSIYHQESSCKKIMFANGCLSCWDWHVKLDYQNI